MDKFSLMLDAMPMAVFAFIFLILFFLLYFIIYIYMCLNLKIICKIVFDDEYRYKAPLEPFDFLFLSFIPTTFWRELLNLKRSVNFKNLYEKDFYLRINKEQLRFLLSDFPCFFVLQYIAIFSGILFMLLIVASYYLES